MAPKQDQIYSRERSKSVAPSARMVIGTDDERNPEYVPPGTSTPSRAARAPRATPKKGTSSVVTASQYDEEHTLTGKPSGSATNEEGASGSLGVSWSDESSGFAEALTPATDQPNRWCVDGKFQVYSDAKFLIDKGFMTRTLTLERRVLTGSLPTMPTLRSQIDRRAAPAKEVPLEQVRVWGVQLVKDDHFLREPSLRETTKRWMALHLSVDGEGADWVIEPKGAIKKDNLTFTAKFLWLIVRHCLSPTAADNIITWDRAELMAAMIAGFEVDFAWLLQAVMHERAFKVTTTYPFPCMIFSLCRSACVPIWNVDQLKIPQGTVVVGLIRDEANELAPCRGPRPELPPLADDLTETVAQTLMTTQAASTDTTPVESIPGTSTAPSSFRTAPLPALVPLARVKKLEAQMATLLHHIQPWTQRSIAKTKKRLELKTIQYSERKIAEVHQCLVAFEFRVLDQPAPPPTEDTVLAALFATSEIPPPPPREHAKRRRDRAEDEARARKKEHREMEAARRASLAEKAVHLMRAGELAVGASSS
ncbi:hypothetical protein EJD97_010271 [Solanum chilense]|uniref:Putative plant transposon protein domain-containing protein n=1 Tax=Solanum chilense TaxID=4083 RepID=A0A6N2AGH8_SOLCI|nr:hypothetical protein EJD97_010271 [Solanum chilense]